VPWWPPAPGWYVLLALGLFLAGWLLVRAWLRWRANAYRRAALGALRTADSPAAISEVLRRTALAIAPRSTVAQQTGAAWPAWLAERYPGPLPDAVQEQLTRGVYDHSHAPANVDDLRAYAARWIEHHRPCGAGED
jgi:hypothetical protein